MSTGQDPKPAGTGDVSVAELQRMAADIAGKIDDLQRQQRAFRVQTLMALLVVVVVIVVFLVATISKVSDNLAAEKVTFAVQKRVDGKWAEMVQKKAEFNLGKLRKAYEPRLQEAFTRVRPQLEQSMLAEMQGLAPRLQGVVSQEFDAAMDRVGRNIKTEVEKEFPQLKGDRLEKVAELMTDTIHLETVALREHLEKQLLQREIERFRVAMEKFPVPDSRDKSLVDLRKQFVHDMLMWIDYEQRAYGTPEGLERFIPEITFELVTEEDRKQLDSLNSRLKEGSKKD